MRVTDLTLEELELPIEETVSETFQSLLMGNGLVDPGVGKQLRPEFAAHFVKLCRRFMKANAVSQRQNCQGARI